VSAASAVPVYGYTPVNVILP